MEQITKTESDNLRVAIEIAIRHAGSQSKLAAVLSVEQPTVSRIKKGSWPMSSTHVAFAKWIGITVTEYYALLKTKDPIAFQQKFDLLLEKRANQKSEGFQLCEAFTEGIDLLEMAESLESFASKLRGLVAQKDKSVQLSNLEVRRLETLIRASAMIARKPEAQAWLDTLGLQADTIETLIGLAIADDGASMTREALDEIAPFLPKVTGWNEVQPKGFSFERMSTGQQLLDMLQ